MVQYKWWLLGVAMFCGIYSKAEDPFCRIWYSEDSLSKIQIYKEADGLYYGKLVWMKYPYTNGKPKLDSQNPDKALRWRTLQGLPIVLALKKKTNTFLDGGKVYDPTRGNYYHCRMTLMENKLELRGYILGMPFLGRTTTWWLAG
jgi:uncharacterized protein (DUF2147 family)